MIQASICGRKSVRNLTLKQRRFCQHYASLGNATEAAIRAGYSRKTARAIAQENLTKPDIIRCLDTLTGPPEESLISTAIERQEWLSKLIFGEVMDSHVLPDGTVIQVPMKFRDRIRAAELLARMRGELVHNHNLSGDVTLKRVVLKWYDGSGG